MSPNTCRIILVDHASRLPLWEASASEGRAAHASPEDTPLPGGSGRPTLCTSPGLLTPIDPAPFTGWGVHPLAIAFQVGAGPYLLADLLPGLTRLQESTCRLCYSRTQEHLLVLLEKRINTPLNVPAMRREIEALARSAAPAPSAALAAAAPVLNGSAAKALGAGPHHLDLAGDLPAGVRILVVVEDEMVVRGVCVRVLQTHFVVFEVSGSHDALALADTLPLPLHILVTDVNLPGIDGIRLARAFRQRRPQASILFLSGDPPIPGLCSPDVGFLQKPFLGPALVRAVTQLSPPAATPIGA